MRRRRKGYLTIGKRGLLRGVCLLAALPLSVRLITASLPYLGDILSRAAVMSAGFALPDGTGALLRQTLQKTASEPEAEQQPSPDTEAEAPKTDEFSGTPEDYIRPADAGNIVRQQFTAGQTGIYLPLKAGYIKNVTDHSAAEITEALKAGMAFRLDCGGEPEVLIYHTHATESYEPVIRDFYLPSYSSRSTDPAKNMIRVGDAITAELQAAGIGVIHDTTQHDNPSYTGGYDRSAVTIRSYLSQYPSIKVVLDIHRDGIQQADGTRIAPVAEINGSSAAQVMIISGCDDGTMGYPNYFQNLNFAAALQVQLESDYPGLTRPILFDYRKYNQHLSSGGLLLEVGAHGNSLGEAVYTGELIGKSLARLLKGE